MEIYQSCKLVDSGEVINITKPFFDVQIDPPPNGTFNQGAPRAVSMQLLFSCWNLVVASGTSGGFLGAMRPSGTTRFYSRWCKYSPSLFAHQSSFTSYMKPTVPNKCLHSRRTTIATNNLIRRKALPNRRMDKPPLVHPLSARVKIPPPTLPPTLNNQTFNLIPLPSPHIPIPQ